MMIRKFTMLFFVLTVAVAGFSQTIENIYYPQIFFNKKNAQDMIALGKSTLEGVAFTKQKTKLGYKPLLAQKHYAEAGTKIILLPCTDYFYEWYRLKNQLQNKNTRVYMSDEAFGYRIESSTDSYGRFIFKDLKPGKYYIEAVINFTVTASYQSQTGVTDYYSGGVFAGSSPSYSTFFYNYETANRESEFVEIKRDGQVIQVKLH